ncbi:MAG: aldolase catalytic domain-containing protein [Candidatus Sumerlaeia bacterium]|nr:aldolase catalytic domain-containing protein [Candidatus Sumerlaeia bacterium]
MQQAPWITFRPEIRVLDCTVRDGGLINDHQFSDEFVRAVYETCVESGIDYMEIGYKGSPRVFPREKFGDWKFCEEESIRRIVGDNPSSLKLAVMADAGGKCDWKTQILEKKDSVIDMVRVACYVHQISEAAEMIEDAHAKGYETMCNIMAISSASEAEVDQALEVAVKTPAGAIVVVDSFGALYSEQIARLVRKYLEAGKEAGKEVGIHAHNNQQLAFANTIEAIIQGANRIDATMAGMGRGAGNCPMELLIGFLRNPKFKTRPIWKLLQDHFAPLQGKMEWGPYPPYIVVGQMNQHPRAAMEFRAGDTPDNCLDFYDKVMADI